MVYYCSVKGCKNNSKMRKKDPSLVLSFHAFPTKEATKQKWLRAIGRHSWKPPSFARICSAHFDLDHISYEGCRIRMTDDACPVHSLPPNANFEASDVEVCRMCLATDLKLFSLQEGLLSTCVQSFGSLKENCISEGLPQFVCYECSARLINCYNLIEQSAIAQAVLLDVFKQNGEVTKNLVKQQDRKSFGLESSLQCHIVDVHKYIINEELNFENESNINKNTLNNTDSLDEHIENDILFKQDPDEELNDDSSNLEIDENGIITQKNQALVEHQYIAQDHIKLKNDLDVSNDFKLEFADEIPLNPEYSKRSGLKRNKKDVTEFFKIVILTREQQKQQWQFMITKRNMQGIWQCKVCNRKYTSKNAYNYHMIGHDPSRGKAECPICFLRYKTDALVQTHLRKYHERIFYCKACSRCFYNINAAKSHRRIHAGRLHKCPRCEFESRHASAVGAHVRTAHAHAAACELCGRPVASERGRQMHLSAVHGEFNNSKNVEDCIKYPCVECDINFACEEAKRVHLLTSKQHRKKFDLCDPLPNPATRTVCSKCGTQFPTTKDLIAHNKTNHPRPKRSPRRSDGYPQKCEHCDEMMDTRWQHWLHVRRQHPEKKHSYRAQHNCVCHRCGKQFQNSTKLRVHELRHGAASLRCAAPACARAFHDRYALARHARRHAPRATRANHACALCARAFRTSHNLMRHQRVHTGETPYGCNACSKRYKHSSSLQLHIRSVHCNLPILKRNKIAVELDK